ncbi:hypothetical protein [Streptomyces sp. SID12488]|uniref:hypothetical protein n=1 Tax=Streptomyces sp. SID12488 TaxID=2706040 RepID=UPI0013DAC53F|nr:hypothetical protein [Streptomyces sp. SID12488]NEA66459.1 hypothetical protein [Streptomyces sp. SID12488]
MRRWGLLAWGVALVASPFLLGITFFVGIFSGGHEIDETCASLGQPLDDQYRAEHWREPGQWFPLHNKCNADYDLVPVWVNPAIVVLTLLIVVCMGIGMWLAVARLVAKRQAKRSKTAKST